MKRQVKHVAASGITTVLVIALVILFVLLQYLTMKQESQIAEELSNGLNDLQYLTTEYIATGTPRALKQWQSRHERLGAFLEGISVRDKQVRRLMPELRSRHQSLGSVFRKLTRIETTINDPERAKAAHRSAVSRMLHQVLALSSLKERISEVYKEREVAFLRWGAVAIGVVLLIGTTVMVFLYVRVLNSIAANVETLSEAIVRLGNGNFTDPVPQTSEGDIGDVLSALEQTRVQLADATAQMEQERADLDHFVYVASHDFKAPLRGIDNLATWIEEDAGESLNNEAREHLVLMRRRIRRLETLLDDLLAYSRAGRANVESENVDVAKLVSGIVNDLHLPAGIKVILGPDLPVIFSPKAPLEHIFFNLIGNAVKHHDKSNGCIEVTGQMNEHGYAFMVCDDGPGIPARFRDRIFEMFQTLKPRDVVEGSGMGLAIAKRLVQSYNGTIEVVGDEGRGTCFSFTWPSGGDTYVQSTE